MSVSEWKKFNFFNATPCIDYNRSRCNKSEITAVCCNSRQKVFCDSSGWVHVFIKNWEASSFQAHSCAINFCTVTNENNLLITCIQESPNRVVSQIFNLNKITKRNGAPCLGTARINTVSKVSALQACLIDTSLCIAVGFEIGDIQLYRGAISREISSFQAINVSPRAITGIEFKTKNALSTFMFVCTNAGIFCYLLTSNNPLNETKCVLDTEIKPARCCTIHSYSDKPGDSYFVVGFDDAIYCYTSDGRGPCYAIDGEKQCISWVGNYLFVALHQNRTSFQQSQSQANSSLIVIDINNKMIVMNKVMDPVQSILIDNLDFYVLTKTNDLFLLHEIDMASKIRILTSKNLFDIAFRLLESSNGDDNAIGNICMQYGDYMLNKGDLDVAIEKYIKTIGTIEPYCVIQKLLDSRYNKYLAQYLQALVNSEYASDEYLNLLLNCNERIELPNKMEQLLPEENHEKLPNHNLGNKLDIFLGTNANVVEFLEVINDKSLSNKFFSRLTVDKVYEFFLENGKMLMTLFPTQIIEILNALSRKDIVVKNGELIEEPERFIPLILSNSENAIEFLENIIKQNSDCHSTIFHILLELCLQAWKKTNDTDEKVLNVIKTYKDSLNPEHVLIVCRTYGFWPGVLLMHKLLGLRLPLHYFAKSFTMQETLFATPEEYLSDFSPQSVMQSFNQKNELTSENSIRLFNNLLNAVINGKQNQSLLQVLQSAAYNKNLLVSHIKPVFTQEHFQKTAGNADQSEVFTNLYGKMRESQELLTRFKSNPIEFRSNNCDICKQELQLPAVYFLCQHSYHKECMLAYSENQKCVACFADKTKGTATSYLDSKADFEKTLEELSQVTNVMEVLSELLSFRVFNAEEKENEKLIQQVQNTAIIALPAIVGHKTDEWVGRIIIDKPKNPKTTYATSKNPFETEEAVNTNAFDDYDANLNPFAE